MSGFDPSVLERKDRDELSQIAESLGQKPPSRARKADIVDLILRLAGVPSDAVPANGAEPAKSEDEAGEVAAPAAEPPAAEAPEPAEDDQPAPAAAETRDRPDRGERNGRNDRQERNANGDRGPRADRADRADRKEREAARED